MFPRRSFTIVLALLLGGCGGASEPDAAPPAPRPGGYPQPGDLVGLLRQDNPYLRRTVALIARTANDQEKEAAGAQLVALADHLGSDAWRATQLPLVARMSRWAQSSSSQRAAWLDELQRRHLVRVYDSMQTLGGERIFDHCRAAFQDSSRRPIQRKLALGVLASHGLAKRGAETPWSMPDAAPRQGGSTAQPSGAVRWPGAPAAPSPRRADAPRVKGGTIVDVDGVVDALRPYFKACYVQALQHHGRFGAWIILVADVGADGRVSSVSSSGDDSAPYGMMVCLRNVVGQARFSAPSGGSAVVEIPLAFTVDETAQGP